MAAIYGDNPREYPYSPQKRKKQKYTMITRVVDFTTNLPITSGGYVDTANASSNTTAWAAGDVLQTVRIRAGQTVLAVQIEVMTPSTDTGDWIQIGFGSDTDRWGKVDLFLAKGQSAANKLLAGVKNFIPDKQYAHVTNKLQQFIEGGSMFGSPFYFATADTIDIYIGKAVIQGKIRIIVHLTEDDR